MVFGFDDVALGLMAGSAIAGTVGGFMGGGSTGVSRDDQRWLNDFSWHQSLRNEEFQHQLATSGIQMRVADAQAAGLSPLVGAGIAPYSGGIATPVFGSGGDAGSSVGAGLRGVGDMGQNLSRALMQARSKTDRQLADAAVRKAAADADVAQNQAIMSSRAVLRDGMLGPGLPTPDGSPAHPFPSRWNFITPAGDRYDGPSGWAAESSHGEIGGRLKNTVRGLDLEGPVGGIGAGGSYSRPSYWP